MIIEYEQGTIRRKIQGHRRVINKDDDVSNEADFVQVVARSMFSLANTQGKSHLLFNSDDFSIRVDDRLFTPESDLSSEPIYIQTFINTIYGFNDGFNKKQYDKVQNGENPSDPLSVKEKKKIQKETKPSKFKEESPKEQTETKESKPRPLTQAEINEKKIHRLLYLLRSKGLLDDQEVERIINTKT